MIRKLIFTVIAISITIILLKIIGVFTWIVIQAVFNGFFFSIKEIVIEGKLGLQNFKDLGLTGLYLIGIILVIGAPLFLIGRKVYNFVYLRYMRLKFKMGWR